MKISIITVCYNAAATIEETIQSVLSQNHKHIEYIVVDGASTDGTMQVVAKYCDHFAHVISEADRGIYDAMNKGVALATGDIIGMLNADDVYAHSEVLATVAARMQHDNLEAIYADVGFFRGNAPEKMVRRFRSAHFSPAAMAYGWMPAHPTLFFRREIYQRFGQFRTDYKISSDFEFIARVFQHPIRYAYVPEIWVRMRMGGISTGGIKSTILLNREVLDACRRNGINTNIFKILCKYPRKILDCFL